MQKRIVIIRVFVVFFSLQFLSSHAFSKDCSVVLRDQSVESARQVFEESLVLFVTKNNRLPKRKELLDFTRNSRFEFLDDFQSATRNFSQLASFFSNTSSDYSSIREALVFILDKDLSLRRNLRSDALAKYKNKLAEKLTKALPTFFKQNFRVPRRDENLNEFAKLISVSKPVFEAFFDTRELVDIWKTAVLLNEDLVEDVQNMIVSALVRFMKQPGQPTQARVTPRAPTLEELFESLMVRYKALKRSHSEGLFAVSDLQVLIGGLDGDADIDEETVSFDVPLLFDSQKAMLAVAQEKHPNSFIGYISEEFGTDYHLATLDLVKEKRGFLLTSINNGVPVKLDQLESMLHYANERDMVILIGVVNLETSFIDKDLMEYIENDSRVRIVTQTLDLGPELQVSSIPVAPKNMNVFASMSSRSGFDKTTLVFHPQLQMKTHPSPESHLLPVLYWSTGSLSEPLYPYSTPIQGRTAKLAEGRHVNSFLIVEKASADSGLLGMGMRGRWHIRPSEYISAAEDEVHGFTDYGRFYTSKGLSEDKPRVVGAVMGDLHDKNTNLHILRAFKEQIVPTFGEPEWISVHDGVDNDAVNKLGHHERRNTGARSKAAENGELSILDEHNGYISTLNSMQAAFPNTNLLHIDSNHLYWLPNYVNQRLVDPQNQRLIDQLAYAQTSLGLTPYQFLLNEGGVRQSLIDASPPEVKDLMLRDFIPMSDPDRLKILELGELFTVGPDHRKTYLNFHGHQGINGARPSPMSHANSVVRASMGDSHQPLILGGIYNAGTITNLKLGYNNGGYSGWGHAIVLVYDNGAMQMLYFDSATMRFVQNFDGSFRGADHFTQEPKVIPNTNDILSGSVGDNYGGTVPVQAK